MLRGQLAGKSEQLGRASHFHTAKEVLTAPHGVDYLGPANAEQRTERKAEWRSWLRGVATSIVVALAYAAVAAVLVALGIFIGIFLRADILAVIS